MATLAAALKWLAITAVVVPLYLAAIWAAYDIRLYAINVYGRVIQ
jgi:hypothetical protein